MLKYEHGKGYVPQVNHGNEVVGTAQRVSTTGAPKSIYTGKRRGRPSRKAVTA